jgi:hypothetical protein
VSARTLGSLMVAAALAWPALVGAQDVTVRERLAARGLPPDLAAEVATLADDASSRGLPGAAVADKAIEGWAKHVPPARIVPAVRQYAARLGEGRAALVQAGIAEPPPAAIVASGEALGRGLGSEQVGQVVRAAHSPAAVAPGLTVAAALSAQGLGSQEAVGVVVEAMRRNRSAGELLDLPSRARAMQAEGMDATEIGQRMLRGESTGDWDRTGREGSAAGSGSGHRPPGVPPGMPGEGERRPPESGQRPPGDLEGIE